MAATYLLAMWCPVCRRRDSHLGSHTERENLSGDAKEKGTSGDNREAEIPMHRTGADCPVLVMRRL